MDKQSFGPRVLLVIFFAIVGIAIIVFAASFFGVRIVYDPTIEIDWDATSATIDLIGVIIVPIALLLLQRKWDNDKQDIAKSNQATLEELEAFKQEYEQLLVSLKNGVVHMDGGNAAGWFTSKTDKEKVLQYLTVNMGATRMELCEKLELPQVRIRNILHELQNEGAIQVIGRGRYIKYKVNG